MEGATCAPETTPRGGGRDPSGSDDCFAQAHWRGEGHCRGRHVQKSRVQICGQQIATSVERATAPFQSVLCPVIRAQSASDMPSKLSLTSIQTAPSCQSTGLGRLMLCQEKRCSQVCATWREETHSFLLWPNSTSDLDSTSGCHTIPQWGGGNKATP